MYVHLHYLTLVLTYQKYIVYANVKAQQKHVEQDVVCGLYLLSGNYGNQHRRKTPLNFGISIKADSRCERQVSQAQR